MKSNNTQKPISKPSNPKLTAAPKPSIVDNKNLPKSKPSNSKTTVSKPIPPKANISVPQTIRQTEKPNKIVPLAENIPAPLPERKEELKVEDPPISDTLSDVFNTSISTNYTTQSIDIPSISEPIPQIVSNTATTELVKNDVKVEKQEPQRDPNDRVYKAIAETKDSCNRVMI